MCLKLVVESWETPKPIFREERRSTERCYLWHLEDSDRGVEPLRGFTSKVWCTKRTTTYHKSIVCKKSKTKGLCVNQRGRRIAGMFFMTLSPLHVGWYFQRRFSASNENVFERRRLWKASSESSWKKYHIILYFLFSLPERPKRTEGLQTSSCNLCL